MERSLDVLQLPEEWGKERPESNYDKTAIPCGKSEPHPRHKYKRVNQWVQEVEVPCLGRGPDTNQLAQYKKLVEAAELVINQTYGTDGRHGLMAHLIAQKALFDLPIPWSI